MINVSELFYNISDFFLFIRCNDMIIVVHIRFYIVIDSLNYYNIFMSSRPPFTGNLGIVTSLAIYFDAESSWKISVQYLPKILNELVAFLS